MKVMSTLDDDLAGLGGQAQPVLLVLCTAGIGLGSGDYEDGKGANRHLELGDGRKNVDVVGLLRQSRSMPGGFFGVVMVALDQDETLDGVGVPGGTR